MSVIRVGFVLNFSGTGWLGGVNYFRNLLWAIEGLQNKKIQPVLFIGKKTDPKLIASFPCFETVQTRALDKGTPLWVIRKVLHKLLRRDVVLEHILIKSRINVLSHSTGFGSRSRVRSIGWIPDFQHMHYPNFFSKAVIQMRNEGWRHLVQLCDCIILSSRAAQKDFENFLPHNNKKNCVLQFAVVAQDARTNASYDELAGLYKIESDYFYLPNQFWAHKNHRIVIDALRLLKEQGRNATVISTGSTSDFRNPDYFPELMKYVQDQGVEEHFKVLGVVPFEHIPVLMRNALAIINPSLFEGWSTTVEEAKSIGKKILLSDIDVHREQNPERGFYFGTNDANALAELMAKAIDEFDAGEEANQQIKAIKTHKTRLKKFAEDYEKIVVQLNGAVDGS